MDRISREETARRYVDSAEQWLRKLLHHELSSALGPNYLAVEGVLKKDAARQIAERVTQSNLTRPIDATTFEQAISLLTNPNRYSLHFKAALGAAYPLGREHALLYLTRLKEIRNDIAHGRGCTARQVEQAICYANDLVDALKNHFRNLGMSKDFDVPMIVRYVDNRGNESHLAEIPIEIASRILDLRKAANGTLRPGETLVAEIEIDQSYDPSSYDVSWWSSYTGDMQGTTATFKIENRHVGEIFNFQFSVVSKRDWHRQSGVDDRLLVAYRVLPPI